jgi:hypothetical protein
MSQCFTEAELFFQAGFAMIACNRNKSGPAFPTAPIAFALCLFAATGPAPAWENDTTRTGSTYSTIVVEDTEAPDDACASLCREDDRCRAWTLVNRGNPDRGAGEYAICLLKDSVPEAVPDPCCISGIAEGRGVDEPAGAAATGEDDGQPPPRASAQAEAPPVHRELAPRIVPIGKWPEGIAHDGYSLWVAMSGERRLYGIDPDAGAIGRQVRVGRLPVGVVFGPGGSVYATVATDKTIWSQPPGGDGSVLARLTDYPQAIAADDEAIWVLTWVEGSSSKTRVERIGPAGGAIVQSGILPRNGFDLAVSGDVVWTLHRLDGEGHSEVVGLDKDSLVETTRAQIGAMVTLLVAGEHGNYAAGGLSDAGVVVRLDPETGAETARYEAALPIAAITTGFDYVIASNTGGSIVLLTGEDLTPLQTIGLSTGATRPRDILVWGDRLFMTTHAGSGDDGSLIVVDGWKP